MKGGIAMTRMKYKCTLMSDVILSRTSSTQGHQECLDFIPGNNFLGIVAGKIYDNLSEDEALEIFHSGKVRFGDAHPSVQDKKRGLKVPSSMYYPKLKKASEECYIQHAVDHDSSEIKEKQLKQCRNGFYCFNADRGKHTGTLVKTKINFAIKSAYDSDKRRSEDEQLFVYESMSKGLVMYFEVEADIDNVLCEKIDKALCGMQHIGRSRTAQYGLVKIEKCDYDEVESSSALTDIDGKHYATVYADGRLIFLDENGESTYRPTAEALGFDKNAKIDWSKSQVRTFHYAPWNGKRHTYDTDRCGIEKGSVFVVECDESPAQSKYVGSYKNEGFGRVIYNPDFLQAQADGKALYTLDEESNAGNATKEDNAEVDSTLLNFLKNKRDSVAADKQAYEAVNGFIDRNNSRFKGERFASQWGSIRSLAMVTEDSDKLIKSIENYITHGVAEAKWGECHRKDELLKFMKENKDKGLQEIMINLASEMAKECRKEKK